LGKESAHDIWQLIPHEFWKEHNLHWFSFLKNDAEKMTVERTVRLPYGMKQYQYLMTSKQKVEELWPLANT